MHLQPWRGESRVWELSQNIRSGEDEWFSEVLEQCRQGELSQANYNFLHGFQEHAPVSFWFHRRKDGRRWHKNQACSKLQPCDDCEMEVARRNRLLDLKGDPKKAAEKMADQRFKDCMLITPFNKAVFQFSIHRAQTFAQFTGEPLFWIQAVDKPPAWFAGHLTKDDLEKMKQTWLQYHARKTEGILSLCPCCYHMPMRITSGHHKLYKEYGVHNGATCVLEAWELESMDKVALESSQESQVVLRALPKRLIVRMDRPLTKQYEGLPNN